MRWLLLVLMLVGCQAERVIDALDPRCGQRCYTGIMPERAGVGPCKWGEWKCDSQGEVTECLGYTEPTWETCDNIDNNCDGIVDNMPVRACYSDCGAGTETCKTGEWVGCTAVKPKPEICDGNDNDCDGFIDEENELPIEFCYGGPINTVGKGECRPGIFKCVQGVKVCNDVTPREEVCNLKDDDCDGLTDEGISNDLVDVVVSVDTSGSMINNVKWNQMLYAISAASKDLPANTQFAIVQMDDANWFRDGKPWVYMNFQSAAPFSNSLQLLLPIGGSNEASIDVIHSVSNPTNPLKLNWRSDARRILLLLSDEEAQSFSNPKSTIEDAASMAFGKVKTYVWTLKMYHDTYLPIKTLANGEVFDIQEPPEAMFIKVRDLVQTSCF